MGYRCFKYFLLCFLLFNFGALAQTEEEDEADLIEEEQKSPQIIIYENPQQKSPLINEQVPENVYGSPIPTRREKIIEERQKAEQETENIIQERLELMRIRDEKERLRQLMGPLNEQPNVIHSEESSELKKPSSKKSVKRSRPYFFSFGGGYLNFNNYSLTQSLFTQSGIYDYNYGSPFGYGYGGYGNYYPYGGNFYGIYPYSSGNFFRDRYIFSSYLWSASIGIQEGNRVSFEYKLTWSGHVMSPDVVTGESRFLFLSHTGILKYFLTSGNVRPFLGLGISFNQRFAVPPILYGISSLYHSFAAGPVAGIEIFLGERWAIGAMGRYTVNVYQLSSHRDFFYNQNSYYYPRRIPEEMDIMVGDIYLKAFF